MLSIVKVIKMLLPQDKINIALVDLPPEGDVLLIEESGVRGKIRTFEGYKGEVESNIQFYVRVKSKGGSYVTTRDLLESFYKVVYEHIGIIIGNYEIKYIGEYEITGAMRDKNNNLIVSMDFTIKYRKY